MKRVIQVLMYIYAFVILFSCGSSNLPDRFSETGSLKFTLLWDNPQGTKIAAAVSGGDVCVDYGIDNISVQIIDSSSNVKASGNWPCSDHAWSLEVPVGTNYSVKVEGTVESSVYWRGEKNGINVRSGEPTDAGIIQMSYVGTDTTPPYIISTTPSDSADNVSISNLSVTAIFSEALAESSINETTFTLSDGTNTVSSIVSYNPSTVTATLTPNDNLDCATTYEATISMDVKDMSGIAMTSDYPWSFETELPKPSGVSANPGCEEVAINWDPVIGATSYNIYWSASTGVMTSDNFIENVTKPYHHRNLTNGTNYCYVVTAVDSRCESSLSAEVCTMPSGTIGCPNPAGTWDSAIWDTDIWGP